MAMNNTTTERDLRGYLRVLYRRKWWVIICTVLAVAGAAAYSFTATKKYSATAQLLVQPQNGTVTLNGAPQPITPTDVATDLQLLSSAPVVDAVRARLHLSQLNVKATQQGQTDVISVTATSTRPAQAALIANRYAAEFVNHETRVATNMLTTAAVQLQQQISAIDKELATLSGTPEGAALANQEAVLKEQYAQLQVYGAETSGGVAVVSQASVPTTPSSPKKIKNGLLGLGLGLLVGLGSAFVADSVDDAIYSKDDLEHAAPNVPVMAMVPEVRSWRDRATPMVVVLSEPTSPAAEAYRSLRTSLQFAAFDRSIRSVLVTSPTATEGKTSTVANLGVVLAKVGQRVVLVSADLRRPRLASFFGLDEGIGFTSMMLGDVELDDVLQSVPNVTGLMVLGCGPRPPDPAEVLSSPRVLKIFEELHQRCDILLVDSPPLLPVTDPLLLCGWTDLTLLVVAARQTKKGQLRRAHEQLTHSNAERVGIVFNEVTGDSDYGYGYGYSYTPRSQNGRESQTRPINGHTPDGLPPFETWRKGRHAARPSPARGNLWQPDPPRD